MKIKILVMLIAFVMTACSIVPIGETERKDYSSLKVDGDTQADVKALLGEPVHIDNNPDGRSVYMYDTASNEKTGFMFNQQGILGKIVVFKK